VGWGVVTTSVYLGYVIIVGWGVVTTSVYPRYFPTFLTILLIGKISLWFTPLLTDKLKR